MVFYSLILRITSYECCRKMIPELPSYECIRCDSRITPDLVTKFCSNFLKIILLQQNVSFVLESCQS